MRSLITSGHCALTAAERGRVHVYGTSLRPLLAIAGCCDASRMARRIRRIVLISVEHHGRVVTRRVVRCCSLRSLPRLPARPSAMRDASALARFVPIRPRLVPRAQKLNRPPFGAGSAKPRTALQGPPSAMKLERLRAVLCLTSGGIEMTRNDRREMDGQSCNNSTQCASQFSTPQGGYSASGGYAGCSACFPRKIKAGGWKNLCIGVAIGGPVRLWWTKPRDTSAPHDLHPKSNPRKNCRQRPLGLL